MLIRARGSRLRYRRHTGVAVSGAHSGDVGYLFRLMSVRMAERRLVGCDFSITHPMGSSGDGLRSLLLAQTVFTSPSCWICTPATYRRERTGAVRDYTRKRGVLHTEIMDPANPDHKAGWPQNRAKLWNAARGSIHAANSGGSRGQAGRPCASRSAPRHGGGHRHSRGTPEGRSPQRP